MEKQEILQKTHIPHCLVLAFPAQGHVSPLLQFSKRVHEKGVRVTFVSTFFICKTLATFNGHDFPNITLHTISDGYDEGGMDSAETLEAYLNSFRRVGSRTLSQLITKLAELGSPVDCVVYDSVLPWALDVAKGLGLNGASFFTQPCAVCSIYFHVREKTLKLPVLEDESVISLPGLPLLEKRDLPSFLFRYGSYPLIFASVLDQFSNIDKADWILANTFYELEQEVVEWMMNIWPLKTIGPTVPSMFLDKRIKDDTYYGISLFKPNDEACMKWLDDKPKRSVVYVSFGSMATLNEEQMEEMGWGLIESECYFLWVIRASEKSKLPKEFDNIISKNKGILVTWCPQLQVLSHKAMGCFVSHCGWNSTIEALSLGVPIVGVPQWTDQNTNAKLVMDVWKTGVTIGMDEKGCFKREEVKKCVKEVMKNERGIEMRKNAMYWKDMARNAVDKGGSSDNNIKEFVAGLVHS